MSISKITKSLESSKDIKFPPVHLWNPELCIGQQISINREGEWFYNKSIIKNQKLVKSFLQFIYGTLSYVLGNKYQLIERANGFIINQLSKTKNWLIYLPVF